MVPSELATTAASRSEVNASLSPVSPLSSHVGHSRTFSMSSDRPSVTGSGFGGLLSMPTSVSPEPNYIAASAASQIVTNDYDSHADAWFDQHGIEPSGETAMVAPLAMKSINKFLDQLLFQFLVTSKSVSLASLRPAVIEILKPKLAKGAIAGADQELNEYLGGGEDEELLVFHNNLEPKGQWDLELVWKRTRLRCMVYSSLGDMEEDDEDRFTEEGGLEVSGNSRFSNSSGVVSPAVAIFLTSILEFMGEQALIVAGQAAYHRLQAKHEKDESEGTHLIGDIADRVVVTEMDMERVALDRTLGRLWRGWKKRIRSPSQSLSMGRSFSRESLRSRAHSRRGSTGEPSVPTVDEIPRKHSVTESMIHENAASIALPIGENDVREIEIPGLAHHSDDEDEDLESDTEVTAAKPRPKSMVAHQRILNPSTPDTSEPSSPVFLAEARRTRSNSVPTPVSTPFLSRRRQQVAEGPAEVSATDPKIEEGEEDETAGSIESTEEETPAKPTREDKGILAGVIASAAAVGIAAVAGITAAAKGKTPEQYREESDSEAEEAQIMTSSRVSIGGRRSPEEPSIPSRASSVRRPQSVQSVRLVDVAHSPTRPRQGSGDSMDYITARTSSLSRASSVHSTIELARTISPIQRTATASPIARSASAINHQTRINTENALPEVQKREITSHPRAPVAIVVPERSPLREYAVPVKQQNIGSARTANSGAKSANSPSFGEPQFVLAPAPINRAAGDREAYATPTSSGYHSPSLRTPDSGAPPLTPLREMMEGAPDTSDEASSVAPSVETNEGHAVAISPVYRSYEGSRSSEQPRSLSNSNSPQRVKRSSPSQPRREDDSTPKPQSRGKSDRQLHTSGSSTSSASHKVRPIRTSEDSHRNGGGKSFDELIQSDQTIQYTLTPQNMREIESPESPRNATMPPFTIGREGSRSRSHSNKSNKSVTKTTGLSSNPPLEAPKTSAKSYKPIPRPSSHIANSGSRVRSNAPQARDARVERESNIGDFADFIRSTGPPGVTLPAANGYRSQNGNIRNNSAPRAVPLPVVSEPRNSSSSAARRLQAREAVVPAGDNTSDLIDFIRQGPPSEKNHDNPRIPRTVAPFRTTMDSDQMSGAVGGRVPDVAGSGTGVRDSAASSNITNENSMHSSINSQSALLNPYKPAATKPAQRHNTFDEEDHKPKRKQRRVRDPYAIDFSDEEEDDDVNIVAAPVRKPQRKEESLIDFLNNVQPPKPTTSSVFDDVPQPVIKKSSTPSLMSRFSRHGSTDTSSKLTRKDSFRPSTSTSARVGVNAPQIPPTHIPISVTIPDSYSPSGTNSNYNSSQRPSDRDNYASRLEGERNPGSRPRVQQKSYQPRDATMKSRGGASSELADFLMNTEPPKGNGLNGPNYGSIDEDDKSTSGSGFVRSVFGRRKKVHV